MVGGDAAAELHEGDFVAVSGDDALELADGVDAAAVDVAVGEVMEEVFVADYVDLFLQQLGAPRPDAGQVHDVLCV